MMTCEQCRDRLLDHVYGLLEESDLRELREHLEVCADCRTALAEGQAEQALFAKAAKAVTEVPEFSLPSTAPAPLPATVPMMSAPAKRSTWRKPWFAWAAAAAVLLAVGASLSYFHSTRDGLQKELTAARQKHQHVSEQFAALPATYQKRFDDAVTAARDENDLHLHVVGPTTLLSGGKGHLHITTRNLEGKPAQADVVVKLVEPESKKTVQMVRLHCDREAATEIDARDAKANTLLNLVVEAEQGLARARVQEPVRILPATYATRIDTNKAAYQYGDVLFFRVLVLDRFALTPPSQPMAMRVELLDPKGQAVRSLDLPTGDGGILAQEFAIDETFKTGAYTLRAVPADTKRTDVLGATHRLEVVRDLVVPDIVFDKKDYQPGDEVTGIYRGLQKLSEKATIGAEAVPLTTEPRAGGFGGGAAPGIPGGGGPFEIKKKDGKGVPGPVAPSFHVQRFAATLPPKLPAGPSVEMKLKTANGAQAKEIRVEVPLAPREFRIDFFPEGGDLIQGVQNRVYYRVRTKAGEPFLTDGNLTLFPSRGGAIDSSYQLGMGYLDFVPDAKEKYTVRIKTQDLPAPFAVRTDGVVVHVPHAVGSQGDPIRVTVRHQGPARKLLVLAQCRGQIVDQRWVEITKKDEVDLELIPTQDAIGMIRVTAYELTGEGNTLIPVAERLVYRSANQRLDLGFKLNTDQLRAGRMLTATITARDEKGQLAPAWVLASIVDERYQVKPRSLSAHFLLLNDIRTGPDLDDAQVILHDGPESAAVLERFLGTHGWRRFVRTQEPPLDVANDPAKRPAQSLVFSRESQSLDDLQRKLDGRLAVALKPIQVEAFTWHLTMENQVAELASAVQAAADRLHRFEDGVQLWIRLGLGILLAVLLIASLGMMGVGIYRAARGQKQATASFGSAFACLVACLGLVFLGAWLGPWQVTVVPPMAGRNPAADDVADRLERGLVQAPAPRVPADKSPTGAFVLRGSPMNDMQAMAAMKHESESGNFLREQLASSLARRENAADGSRAGRAMDANAADRKATHNRFEIARNFGKVAAKGAQIQPPDVPTPKLKGDKKASAEKTDARPNVEYAYKYEPGLFSDTLLWHPTLRLDAGRGEVHFDMTGGLATYRVLLLGHSPSGRFGFYETHLDVPAGGR